MPFKYYKKSKIKQLKSFCAVVELGCSLTNASEKLNISISTISMQIKSLEYDLKLSLFDRNGKVISLNNNGKGYYKDAKRILLNLNEAYSGNLDIKKVSWLKIYVANTIKGRKKAISKFLKKMIVEITVKKVIISVIILFACLVIYLNKTNYFFDKKIRQSANPLLKEIIDIGYYRVPKTECPFTTYQFFHDMYDLMMLLVSDKSVHISEIGLYDCPSTTMRFNGTEENDRKFYDKKIITCDIDRRFEANKYEYMAELSLLKHDNFRIYSLYRKTDCLNHKTFIENVSKYKNLSGIMVDKNSELSNAAMSIIKKGSYYYMIFETNGKQPGVDLHDKEERYLVFKKLTLPQLMEFDNGRYWRLIKEYNIKID